MFIASFKLAISFLRTSAKKSVDQGIFWNVVVSRDSRGFSASSILTQLGLLLAGIIFGVFSMLLGILLGD